MQRYNFFLSYYIFLLFLHPQMKTAEYLTQKLFLLGMTLLALTASAQSHVTKSGTPVVPADRVRALFTQSGKQSLSSDPSTLEVSFIYGEELDFKKKKESDAKANVLLFKLSNYFNMKEKDFAIKMNTQRI